AISLSVRSPLVKRTKTEGMPAHRVHRIAGICVAGHGGAVIVGSQAIVFLQAHCGACGHVAAPQANGQLYSRLGQVVLEWVRQLVDLRELEHVCKMLWLRGSELNGQGGRPVGDNWHFPPTLRGRSGEAFVEDVAKCALKACCARVEVNRDPSDSQRGSSAAARERANSGGFFFARKADGGVVAVDSGTGRPQRGARARSADQLRKMAEQGFRELGRLDVQVKEQVGADGVQGEVSMGELRRLRGEKGGAAWERVEHVPRCPLLPAPPGSEGRGFQAAVPSVAGRLEEARDSRPALCAFRGLYEDLQTRQPEVVAPEKDLSGTRQYKCLSVFPSHRAKYLAFHEGSCIVTFASRIFDAAAFWILLDGSLASEFRPDWSDVRQIFRVAVAGVVAPAVSWGLVCDWRFHGVKIESRQLIGAAAGAAAISGARTGAGEARKAGDIAELCSDCLQGAMQLCSERSGVNRGVAAAGVAAVAKIGAGWGAEEIVIHK
ncbi:unnamed protein product, partial [Prorocentrum cordatum]